MAIKGLTISDSEWKIMKILWDEPMLTLRQIDEKVKDAGWSYTTVRTMVTRLAEKGAVGADRSLINNFKYYPIVSKKECRNKEVKNLVERVFDGSKSMLVSSLVKESNLTKEEQLELMAIIEKMD